MDRQWPQHPTEPRFSYASPAPFQPHRFMLSNDVTDEECAERFKMAIRWCSDQFGPGSWTHHGRWSHHGAFLIVIHDASLALAFRMRFC